MTPGYHRHVVFVVVAVLLVPFVELAVFIQVSAWIGVWQTLAMLLMVSFVGAWMVKQQGTGAWWRIREELARGRVPTAKLVDTGLLAAAGFLFLIPGFVTDAVAALLLLPPVRAVVRGALGRRFRVAAAVGPAPRARGDRGSRGWGTVYDVESRVRDPRPPRGELDQ